MAAYDLEKLLRFSVKQRASDLIIKAGQPPIFRIHGDLIRMGAEPISREDAREISMSVLTPEQVKQFEDALELDYAHEIAGVARFRVNIMQQRNRITSVYRTIPFHIQTMDQLGLPSICKRFSDYPRGLVLVTGPTGSGKSTTLAAMIDYINREKPTHIMTVEDPLEFLHTPQLALVNQREVGSDTLSFPNALKYVLRQDPDVILIGEMRDLETIHLAISAAETGHLVFGTLHTTDAVQTIDRVIDVFPPHQQQQVRMQLSVNIVGVLSQALIKTRDKQGRVAAFEIMEAIPAIRNLIREGKTHQIGSSIQTGQKRGMMTLDQSLVELVARGIADYESARDKAHDYDAFDEMLERRKADGTAVAEVAGYEQGYQHIADVQEEEQ
ncbi:MAG: type IV pilus twitching motility protein PilT [Armatimonadia bacterium]